LRKTSHYMKSEYRERIAILNQIHLVKEFISNQNTIRDQIDSLEILLSLHTS
jgi:hypothetical protein